MQLQIDQSNISLMLCLFSYIFYIIILNSSTQSRAENFVVTTGRSSSPSFDLNLSTTPRLSGSVLIEGSLEYRELKRAYLFENNQSSEWKKDYGVLKQ